MRWFVLLFVFSVGSLFAHSQSTNSDEEFIETLALPAELATALGLPVPEHPVTSIRRRAAPLADPSESAPEIKTIKSYFGPCLSISVDGSNFDREVAGFECLRTLSHAFHKALGVMDIETSEAESNVPAGSSDYNLLGARVTAPGGVTKDGALLFSYVLNGTDAGWAITKNRLQFDPWSARITKLCRNRRMLTKAEMDLLIESTQSPGAQAAFVADPNTRHSSPRLFVEIVRKASLDEPPVVNEYLRYWGVRGATDAITTFAERISEFGWHADEEDACVPSFQ